MTIYALRNKLNNKYYIGQTVEPNPYRRIQRHFTKQGYYNRVYPAVLKYGKDAFEIIILATANSLEELNELERYYVRTFDSVCPNGYNLREGGQQKGGLHEETKRKISEKLRGHTYLKGITKTREHREAMSKARKGFSSPARREARKRSAALLKKPVLATNVTTGETRIFSSIEKAAKTLKVQGCNISRVCRGIQNRSQAGGYRFSYIKAK